MGGSRSRNDAGEKKMGFTGDEPLADYDASAAAVFTDNDSLDFDDNALDVLFESSKQKAKPNSLFRSQNCVQTENQVKLSVDGPLELSGRVEIFATDGGHISSEQCCSLCRCGASRHKPFCDGSHKREGFEDPGQLMLQREFGQPLTQADGELRVRISLGGPYILQGPVTINSADTSQCLNREKIALCRCGASSHKPFCDGSHRSLELSED